MNRILRVVGGPLKGAEIALVAGTRVKVGSGDGCDVLVSDPSLGDVAFELEVAEDEVSIITPDGATKTLLDYEAHTFGASSFAIGAAEGVWPEVVWPERKSEEERGKSEEGRAKSEEGRGKSEEAGKMPPRTDPLKERSKDARPEMEDAKGETIGKKRRVSCLVPLVLLALVIVLTLFAVWWLRCRKNCCAERCDVVAPRVTLADVADKYGISVVETNGQVVLRGNLKTRAERLEATAAVFQAKPGVELDLMDDESLDEAAGALVAMIVGDALKVEAATNRIVVLRGDAGTAETLRQVLAAMARDIPGLQDIDCARVVCGDEAETPVKVAFASVRAEPQLARSVETVRKPTPGRVKEAKRPVAAVPQRLPLCGILTVPYPCIIQKNGNRVFEGGEFGGYTVEKITATGVTLRDGERAFEWKP